MELGVHEMNLSYKRLSFVKLLQLDLLSKNTFLKNKVLSFTVSHERNKKLHVSALQRF